MRTLILLALPLFVSAQEVSPAGISPEKEAALGAGLAKEYQRRMTVIENAPVLAYLAGLCARLRASLSAGTPEFRVSLVANEPDGPPRAPVALPGGYLIVATRKCSCRTYDEQFHTKRRIRRCANRDARACAAS